MKATTQFLNEIVLVNQPTKLTPKDRSAVRQYLLQRWGRTPPSEREQVFAEAVKGLTHYEWPPHVAELVVRLIATGVTDDDDILARAWRDRRDTPHEALRQAIARYDL